MHCGEGADGTDSWDRTPAYSQPTGTRHSISCTRSEPAPRLLTLLAAGGRSGLVVPFRTTSGPATKYSSARSDTRASESASAPRQLLRHPLRINGAN